MKRNRKTAVVAACLIALMSIGCLVALSQCGSEVVSVATSESKNNSITGKPRIVKLETSTASDEDRRDDDAEEDAVIRSLEEGTVAASNDIQDKVSLDVAPSGVSSSPQHDESPVFEEPARRWVVDYKQIWVEDSPAWDEQVPVYSHSEESVCNICSAVITGNEVSHGKTHMLAGEGSGHHVEYIDQIAGYDTVHHDAVGHWETVEDGGHWE